MQRAEDTLTTERLMNVLDRILRKGMGSSYDIYANPGNRNTVMSGLERMKRLFGVYGGLSEMRMIDFTVYQVYRYRDMIMDWPRGMWTLSWCFGDAAVDKYRQQFMSDDGKRGMNYYIDQWLSGMRLQRESLADMISMPDERKGERFVYLSGEDVTKRRFLNEPSGMLLCLASTTGWTPKSPVCKECKNASECMRHTSRKYPEIARIRKEEQNKTNEYGRNDQCVD